MGVKGIATVQDIFGPKGLKEIGQLVHALSGVLTEGTRINDVTKEDYLHVDLAPSYGTLTSESIKKMDETLKVALAGTMRALEAAKKEKAELTWEKTMAVLMQNPLLEVAADGEVYEANRLTKKGTNWFKFNGNPDAAIVREVQSWFKELIKDEDVLRSTQIDIDIMAKIVARTGAAITNFPTVFHKQEHHEKTVLDIGVLRFPDIENPYFKVYRIELTAWSSCNRIGFRQEDNNGISGVYNARNFKPRAYVIQSMREEVKDRAVQAAEKLFDF